jgi:hypothetical protein
MRYYVDNSSYFDSHPYKKTLISRAVKIGGGKNVRASNKHGWSNQPQVVTFDAGEVTARKVQKAVSRALKTPWIIVREKDW